MESDPLQLLKIALSSSSRVGESQFRQWDNLWNTHQKDLPKFFDELYKLGFLTKYQYRKFQVNRGSELIFGPFVIFDKIGEGGMGKVYRAIDHKIGRTVALKVIRPQLMSNKTAVKRYQREAQAAARLDHPNVVKLYDAEEIAGRYYLAMEYVDGSDLSRLVKENGSLPYQEACEYIRQAALGLQHAHDLGLVHRDIKPSNLLVFGDRALPGTDGKATVKILDMGLVRSMDDEENDHTELTRDGTVVGTPDYMSPEQAKNSSTVDGRADLYSLGCTLYYLIAGQSPFPDGTPIDKLLRHQLDPPPDIRQGRKHIPIMVGGIIHRLLEKKPEDRYQTASEVAQVLAAFTPDAANIDLTAPTDLHPPLNPLYAVDLSPPKSTQDTVNSTPRILDAVVVTQTQTPPSTRTTGRSTATSKPKVKSIPKPTVEPISSESLPSALSQRPTQRSDSFSNNGQRRGRKGRRSRKTRKPFPVVQVLVGLGLGSLVLIALLIAFSGKKSPPSESSPTTNADGANVVPPKVVQNLPYRNLDILCPKDAHAVFLIQGQKYWERANYQIPRSTAWYKRLKFLQELYHFEPRELERSVIFFENDFKSFTAFGEGNNLNDDWFKALGDRPRFRKLGDTTEAGTPVKFWKGFQIEESHFGWVFGSPRTYAITTQAEQQWQTELQRIQRSEAATPAQPSILQAMPEPTAIDDRVIFSADGNFSFPSSPNGDTKKLSDHQIDLLVLRLTLEKDIQVQFEVVGNSETVLRDFVNLGLPKILESWHPEANELQKLLILDTSLELYEDRFRLRCQATWTWDQFHKTLELFIPKLVRDKD